MPIRYFLVLLPRYNESGEYLADDAQWVALARETGGAIIACTFMTRPKEDRSIHYAAAGYGSGKALETAVNRMAGRISEPAFEDLPFLMYGHSAGGQFAYGYSCYNPRRLISFVSVKGGIFFPEPQKETYRVPGLIISGEKDLERRRNAIQSLFETHRKLGAPWCWMEEKRIGHSEGECRTVAIPYLKSVLKTGTDAGTGSVKRIDPVSGIWVDLIKQETMKPDAVSVSVEKNINMGWLPDKDVFVKWKKLDNGPDKYTNT